MIRNLTTWTRLMAATSICLLLTAGDALRQRARQRIGDHDPEGGYTTETVIVTALVAAAAIAVGTIIMAKVRARAEGINL